TVTITKGSTGNREYTANWTVNIYTVTFDKQGGSGGTNSVTATYDAAMPIATKPTRTGYTFGGYWDATSDGTQYYTASMASSRSWNKAENTTLYARWTVNIYTVTFGKQGGTG
ncbi:MAG TPA: InlB B-repeat-containing protein, partial [Spirochaetota bacterium]|nr:InlB B-repeat-containing protein [Spirochaetota bacterium]